MLSEEDFEFIKTQLKNEDASTRVRALHQIVRRPTGDARLLPLLDACLDDRTVCILERPFVYGEVRHKAVAALQAELRLLGQRLGRVIVQIPVPLSGTDIELLEKGISEAYHHEVRLKEIEVRYALLRDKDRIERRDVML
ncbi:MAG: hypothetical protein AAFN74_04800 [Myxococcota bacterium]